MMKIMFGNGDIVPYKYFEMKETHNLMMEFVEKIPDATFETIKEYCNYNKKRCYESLMKQESGYLLPYL